MASSAFPEPISGIKESLLDAAGDIVYASADNTPARLGIGSSAQVLTVASGLPSWATPASGTTYVGASVRGSAAQSVADSTETLLLWDTERFDTNSIHSTTTNTGRMTVPAGKTGKWRLSGHVNAPTMSLGLAFELYLFVNGSYFQYGVPQFAAIGGSGRGTQQAAMNLELDLLAGDYIDLRCWHNAGETKNIGLQYSNFQFSYIGA